MTILRVLGSTRSCSSAAKRLAYNRRCRRGYRGTRRRRHWRGTASARPQDPASQVQRLIATSWRRCALSAPRRVSGASMSSTRCWRLLGEPLMSKRPALARSVSGQGHGLHLSLASSVLRAVAGPRILSTSQSPHAKTSLATKRLRTLRRLWWPCRTSASRKRTSRGCWPQSLRCSTWATSLSERRPTTPRAQRCGTRTA
mmetsp:Transcript_92782/g.288840  ORF Transcript_92782/g.288840 Transcript_92782/m.288840 type:complete len:200 (+) Transcript_92782:895-1494(+)